MRALAALALSLWAGAAAAWDFVESTGKLSQDDFYRLVACRAAPGGPCTEPFVRWAPEVAGDITISLAPPPPDYPRDLAAAMSLAVDATVSEINRAGSAVRLRRVSHRDNPMIRVFLTGAAGGQPIRGTGVRGVDGEIIGAALVTVWWNDRNHIYDAVIAMASDMWPSEARSVMLEEVTQGLGLLTDIRNPLYVGVSIFSEDANTATRLGLQDRLVLQRHYPPAP